MKLEFPIIAALGLALASPLPAGVSVAHRYDCRVLRSEIPNHIAPGRTKDIRITVLNTGTATWSSRAGCCLAWEGASSSKDSLSGDGCKLGAAERIAPGQTRTFDAKLRAPASVGVHYAAWRMRSKQAPFGPSVATYVAVRGFDGTGKLAGCEGNGRYLQTPDGDPLFLIGYYAHNRDVARCLDPVRFIQLNQRCGINYFRFVVCYAVAGEDSGDYAYLSPFAHASKDRIDLDKWNPDYWEYAHKVWSAAEKAGIVVHLSIFEGAPAWDRQVWNYPENNVNREMAFLDPEGQGLWDADTFTDPNAPPGKRKLRYLQEKIAARTIQEASRHSNIIFELGNEVGLTSPDWASYWVKFIRARSDKPITINSDLALTLPGCVGATFHVGGDIHGANARDPLTPENLAHGRFIGCDSDGAQITNMEAADARRALWRVLTGGGNWLNYTTEFYPCKPRAFYYSAQSPFAYNTLRAGYYRHASEFIRNTSLPFWAMSPDDSVVISAPSGTRAHCLAGKTDWLIYLYGSCTGPARVKVRLPQGSHMIRTYAPGSGEWLAKREIVSGGEVAIPLPSFSEDLAIRIGRPEPAFHDARFSPSRSGKCDFEVGVTGHTGSLNADSVRLDYSTDGGATWRNHQAGISAPKNSRSSIVAKGIPFDPHSFARNRVRVWVADQAGRAGWGEFAGPRGDQISCEIGDVYSPDGLLHLQCEDGGTIQDSAGGKSCRRLRETDDRCFYFAAQSPPKSAVAAEATVEYYALKPAKMAVEYDGADGAYTRAGELECKTGGWQKMCWRLAGSRFSHRQNAGADLRITVDPADAVKVRKVSLRFQER